MSSSPTRFLRQISPTRPSSPVSVAAVLHVTLSEVELPLSLRTSLLSDVPLRVSWSYCGERCSEGSARTCIRFDSSCSTGAIVQLGISFPVELSVFELISAANPDFVARLHDSRLSTSPSALAAIAVAVEQTLSDSRSNTVGETCIEIPDCIPSSFSKYLIASDQFSDGVSDSFVTRFGAPLNCEKDGRRVECGMLCGEATLSLAISARLLFDVVNQLRLDVQQPQPPLLSPGSQRERSPEECEIGGRIGRTSSRGTREIPLSDSDALHSAGDREKSPARRTDATERELSLISRSARDREGGSLGYSSHLCPSRCYSDNAPSPGHVGQVAPGSSLALRRRLDSEGCSGEGAAECVQLKEELLRMSEQMREKQEKIFSLEKEVRQLRADLAVARSAGAEAQKRLNILSCEVAYREGLHREQIHEARRAAAAGAALRGPPEDKSIQLAHERLKGKYDDVLAQFLQLSKMATDQSILLESRKATIQQLRRRLDELGMSVPREDNELSRNRNVFNY